MTGIPLVNTNSVNDINTSIIAIKKKMKSSGETEVNVNVNLPDTAIPVDEVTSGNMHSVTSNAVANAMSYSTSEINTGKKWIDGNGVPHNVHRVVLELSSVGTGSTVINISSLDKVVDFGGYCIIGGTNRAFPFIDSGGVNTLNSFTSGSVTFNCTYAMSEAKIWVEYTKTTD